jgi:hypothetical protein
MNSASLETSERLKRVDALLSDNLPHSTLEIVQKASVCAVNSIISELRDSGRNIECQRKGGVWYYRRAGHAR